MTTPKELLIKDAYGNLFDLGLCPKPRDIYKHNASYNDPIALKEGDLSRLAPRYGHWRPRLYRNINRLKIYTCFIKMV